MLNPTNLKRKQHKKKHAIGNIGVIISSYESKRSVILLANRNLDAGVLQKCANTIDESFSTVYQRGRKTNSIGPCELRVLEEGTFDEMRASATTPAQYKLPRFLNTAHLLKLLNDRTLLSFQTTS